MKFHQAAVGALVMTACALSAAACASQQAQHASPMATASADPTPTSTAPSSTGAGATACTTSQLKVALTNTGALGGQAGGYLRFTNDSQTSCRITGWPVVAGLTASGHATTFRHAQSTMFGAWQYAAPLPVLTLGPGDSAYAVVAADDAPAGSQATCAAPDVRLRVSAPGSQSSTEVSAWLPGARTYLPACAAASGASTGETSAVTTLSALPH